MRKNKLLLLLALLMTAATGAWAQDPTYAVKMANATDAEAANWTIASGQSSVKGNVADGLTGLKENDAVTVTYTGRMKVKSVTATTDVLLPTDLSKLTAAYTAQDGEILTGTTSQEISIAAGATVTLKNATINNRIKCLGTATIILADGSTNTVNASDYRAGIQIGGSGTTLTINAETAGTGSLTATGGSQAAGIGTGSTSTSAVTGGNIVINGGTITANASKNYGAGIGTGIANSYNNTCGSITINGGTVTATGGTGGSGIGTGAVNKATNTCGAISITGGTVTANKGSGSDIFYSIGIGKVFNNNGTQTCGTITIGGTKYWENNAAVNGGDTYLAQSPLIYDPTAPAVKPAAAVTTAPKATAAIIEANSTSALVNAGVADGGTMMYAVTTTNTKPTSTDGFSATRPTAEGRAAGTYYVWYYVKADADHSDSEIAGPVSVTVTSATITITWNSSNIGGSYPNALYVSGTYQSYTKEGITLSANANMIDAMWNEYGDESMNGISFNTHASGGFTFTAPSGKKFTKIEMTPTNSGGWDMASLGTGWLFNVDWGNMIYKVTWTGSAASTVGLLTGADNFSGEAVKSIVFYLSE